jgi:methyltransferase
VTASLVAYLAFVAVQRGFELGLSRRNERAVRGRGARLVSDPTYPWIVALHVMFPLALVVEVIVLGARPSAAWPVWLALFAGAQALRYAAMRALGDRWNVRVWVVPGEPAVRSGLYRFVRHPNYVAVAIELVAAPLMFGAWRTALVASAVNAALLLRRMRIEEKALDEAGVSRPASSG